MRTTIELPDDLLKRAKSRAAISGVSLRQFFITAIEHELNPPPIKTRRELPVIGGKGPKMKDLTREQLDEIFFG